MLLIATRCCHTCQSISCCDRTSWDIYCTMARNNSISFEGYQNFELKIIDNLKNIQSWIKTEGINSIDTLSLLSLKNEELSLAALKNIDVSKIYIPFILVEDTPAIQRYLSQYGYNVEKNNTETMFTNIPRNFGGWAIDKELFDYIRTILPEGKTILELGSGWGSGELSKYYTVYSIEHDPAWVGRYNTHYIYAPIKHGWYDIEVLKKELPQHYDLIIVDGPPGTIGRWHFSTYLTLFKATVPIIFDDVNRKPEHSLMTDVAKKLKKPFKILHGGTGKQFGVVNF